MLNNRVPQQYDEKPGREKTKTKTRTLVNIFYAKRRSKFLFQLSEDIPSNHDIPRHYELVFSRTYSFKPSPERFFTHLNQHDSIGQDVAKRVGHTSLSAGDIVCIGNKRYLCQPEGWKEI